MLALLQLPAALPALQLLPVQLITGGISHIMLKPFTFRKIPGLQQDPAWLALAGRGPVINKPLSREAVLPLDLVKTRI